jgi:hypothetical protein
MCSDFYHRVIFFEYWYQVSINKLTQSFINKQIKFCGKQLSSTTSIGNTYVLTAEKYFAMCEIHTNEATPMPYFINYVRT